MRAAPKEQKRHRPYIQTSNEQSWPVGVVATVRRLLVQAAGDESTIPLSTVVPTFVKQSKNESNWPGVFQVISVEPAKWLIPAGTKISTNTLPFRPSASGRNEFLSFIMPLLTKTDTKLVTRSTPTSISSIRY